MRALETEKAPVVEASSAASAVPASPTVLVPQAPATPAAGTVWRRHLTTPMAVAIADMGTVGATYLLLGGHGWRLYVTLLLWPLAFAFAGLYGEGANSGDRFRRLAVAVALGTLSSGGVERLFGLPTNHDWVLRLGAAAMGALWLERRVTIRALRALAPVLGTEDRVVVLGTNHEARTLARSLSRGARPGARLVGLIGPASAGHLDRIPVVGGYEDLEAVLVREKVDAAVLASTSFDAGELADLSARLQAAGVDTSISVGLPAVAATRVAISSLDGIAMLEVSPHRLSTGQRALKRTVDIVGATVALVVAGPVIGLLGLAIRLTSGPEVMYSQLRVGEGGKPFVLYKLRTMVRGADSLAVDLRDRNQADGALFKIFDDPRVTPVGRVLRRYGLDELPQLWNVLRGEMSLVGPRPPLPHEAERYDEWVRGRLGVKPGITGLWQIKGRHELSWDDYVHYDLFYVENWSLYMDIDVILRTVPALLAHRGAY